MQVQVAGALETLMATLRRMAQTSKERRCRRDDDLRMALSRGRWLACVGLSDACREHRTSSTAVRPIV
jgi:hypothetical protein